MPENMPEPSMLPVPNRFQYAPSFFETCQQLFMCHLFCPTDFQHPIPMLVHISYRAADRLKILITINCAIKILNCD